MNGDLVALSVHLLHRGIIGVLVRDEESSLDVATVRILTLAVEDLLIEADVVVVDGVVEGYRNHLRHILEREIPGYCRTILRAETVGQNTHGGVAWWGSIRIVVHI